MAFVKTFRRLDKKLSPRRKKIITGLTKFYQACDNSFLAVKKDSPSVLPPAQAKDYKEYNT